MNKNWNTEKLKNYFKEHGFIILIDEYKDYKQKYIVIDSEGYYYFLSIAHFTQRKNPYKFHKSNPYTIQNIKLWLKLNSINLELISDIYNGSHKKLKFKCLKEDCKEEFEMNWNNMHFNKYGCTYCSGHQVGLSNCLATKNPQVASEWHPTKNGSLTPYDFVCGSHENVWWQCSKNPKHEWPAIIKNRSKEKGNGCPYCAGLYASEDYNLLKDNPELCEEWDYNKNEKKPEEYTPNSGQYAWWRCKECGHEWYAIIASRNNGNGCPECNKSLGEKKIDEILINNNWIKISQKDFEQLIDEDKYNNNYFIPQKEFNGLIGTGGGLLSYDHYIPKLNLLIEYQGEFHDGTAKQQTEEEYKIQQEHDKRKKEYALKHNINLLEIWYWNFNNIEKILLNIINKGGKL